VGAGIEAEEENDIIHSSAHCVAAYRRQVRSSRMSRVRAARRRVLQTRGTPAYLNPAVRQPSARMRREARCGPASLRTGRGAACWRAERARRRVRGSRLREREVRQASRNGMRTVSSCVRVLVVYTGPKPAKVCCQQYGEPYGAVEGKKGMNYGMRNHESVQ